MPQPLIVSASRRTDIPAFYARWFMQRIRAGYCHVPNPFNPRQISRVSLRPADVAVLVFWTRQALPLLPYLDELDAGGFRYYFLYTVTGLPSAIEPSSPSWTDAVAAMRRLAERIGPERVIWRYDPIVFSSRTDVAYHHQRFREIALALRGVTQRCVISLLVPYSKVLRRWSGLAEQGFALTEPTSSQWCELLVFVVSTARECGMTVQRCAMPIDLDVGGGVVAGGCIDAAYLETIGVIEVSRRKDRAQRPDCRCVVSKDIGMYETCLFGCQYCYATTNFGRARANHRRHNPNSPSLVGWIE